MQLAFVSPHAPDELALHVAISSKWAKLASSAGDVNSIKVGENSNIQDNVVVHVAKHNAQDRALPTIIGNNVTIGRFAQKPLKTRTNVQFC